MLRKLQHYYDKFQILIKFIFLAFLIVVIAFTLNWAFPFRKEIKSYNYENVYEMVTLEPKLKPHVTLALTDGKIFYHEYYKIKYQYEELKTSRLKEKLN